MLFLRRANSKDDPHDRSATGNLYQEFAGECACAALVGNSSVERESQRVLTAEVTFAGDVRFPLESRH